MGDITESSMKYCLLMGTLRKALESKNLRSATELLSNHSEFIKDSDPSLFYEPTKTQLLAFSVWQEKEYADLIIKLLNLNDETIAGELKIALINRDCEKVISLLSDVHKLSDIIEPSDQSSLVELVFGRWGADHTVRMKLLEFLMKKGLDAHAKDKRGKNILHKFLSHFANRNDTDLVDVVKLLLDYGVPLNEVDRSYLGYTPLHMAIQIGNSKLIEYLLEDDKNMDMVNVGSAAGYTPLHMVVASREVDLNTIDLLLTKGANINTKNKYGETVLHSAKEKNNADELVDYLVKHGA